MTQTQIKSEIFYQDNDTTIICGDILEACSSGLIKTSSVQMAMTSVPYWRQRLYTPEAGEAWGFETDWNDWLARMTDLGRWLKFVIKGNGTLFLNIGDKYGGSNSGSDYGDKRYQFKPEKMTDRQRKTRAKSDIVNRDGNLMLLPYRVAMEFTDELRYTLLNVIIWHKPTAVVQSFTDKFVPVYEPMFLFKMPGDEKHKFSRERAGVEKRDRRVTPKVLVKKEQERVFGKQQGLFGVDEIAYDAGVAPKDQDSDEYRHWYENERVKQAWHDHKDDEASGQRMTRALNLRHPDGSNPGDVWSIMVEHDDFFKDETVRAARTWPSWPLELCMLPILATTDVGDTVLDPFGGSGSLGVAAKQLGRKSILVDMDRESCEIMARRIVGTTAKI